MEGFAQGASARILLVAALSVNPSTMLRMVPLPAPGGTHPFPAAFCIAVRSPIAPPMPTPDRTADVIILGGGLVGLTLALALDRSGLSSTVVDPLDPAQLTAPGFDGRASAIASASWRMMEALGLDAALEPLACPIRAIHVAEGAAGRDGLDFVTQEGDDPLGRMVPNRELRRVLNEAAAEAEHITVLSGRTPAAVTRNEHRARVTLDDGTTLSAPLLVGADGRRSPTRELAALPAARWSYDHAAIVTALTHEQPHDNIAYEIFYPDGPFALLPLLDDADGRHRSALVWSVSRPDAEGLLKLGPRGFAAAAQPKSLDVLGRIELAAERSTYPLSFHHAATIVADRLALVGDAAHGIHPIAGQGLNLGLRDAAALAEVLVEGRRLGLDAGDRQLLARYNRWRALDALSVAGATDGLTRLFGVRGRAAAAVRATGLAAVQRLGPLKGFFMAEARGEAGQLPRLLQGMAA